MDKLNSINDQFICSKQGDYYQIKTPYLYPEGDNIELLCELIEGVIIVMDLAETMRRLCSGSFPYLKQLTPEQKRFIVDICMTYNIQFYRGMLLAYCHPEHNLTDVLTRVAQAILKISYFISEYRPNQKAR